MRYCTKCGTPASRAQQYCTTCGSPLAEPESLTASPGAGPPDADAGPPPRASTWPSAPAGTGPAPPASTGPPAPADTWPPPPPGTGPSPPAHLPRPSGGRTTTLIAAVAGVIVLAGGGVAAWKFLGHHAPHHAAVPSVSTGSVNRAGPGAGSPAANTPTPAVTASGAAAPPPSPPPSGPSETFTVAVTPAVAQQAGEQQVVAFLQSYFTAINNHDYGQYAPLLVPAQRPTPQQFQQGDGSTTDSAATLTGLAPTPNGMAATVKFISHQPPSVSHTGTACTSWRITLFLESHAGGYREGPAPPAYQSRSRPC